MEAEEPPKKKSRNARRAFKRKERREDFGKVLLKVTGSSHASDHHHLPHFFSEKMADNDRFFPPLFDSQGGRKILPGIVVQVNKWITEYNGPQCHVLILGSNNLRRDFHTPEEVCHLFKQILDHSSTIQQCHVVVFGIVPDPTNEYHNVRFYECSRMLKTLTMEYPRHKVSFFEISKLLVKDNQIRKELYAINRGGGIDIHLNETGAKIVAENLSQHLSYLRAESFLLN